MHTTWQTSNKCGSSAVVSAAHNHGCRPFQANQSGNFWGWRWRVKTIITICWLWDTIPIIFFTFCIFWNFFTWNQQPSFHTCTSCICLVFMYIYIIFCILQQYTVLFCKTCFLRAAQCAAAGTVTSQQPGLFTVAFTQCLSGFSPGILAFSHNPKQWHTNWWPWMVMSVLVCNGHVTGLVWLVHSDSSETL